MLRGDLQTTPLADLLRQLADAKATGCVYLLPAGRRSDTEESMVGLRSGAISNVTVPGSEESVATRLVASRQLSPTALAEAREAQETELSNWMLAELLIHLGLADERQVHDLVSERALSDLSDLCTWHSGSWRFRRRQKWGASLPQALSIDEALAIVAERQDEWQRLLPAIRGADAVVSLAAHPEPAPDEPAGSDESVEMDADGFALLCAVDGARTLAELGVTTGFTLLDAGRTIAKLLDAGLVQVVPGPSSASDGLEVDRAADDGDSGDDHPMDALEAALSYQPGESLLENVGVGFAPVGAPWQAPRTSRGDPLSEALARVSAALSEAMSDEQVDGAVDQLDQTAQLVYETGDETAEPEAPLAELEVVEEVSIGADDLSIVEAAETVETAETEETADTLDTIDTLDTVEELTIVEDDSVAEEAEESAQSAESADVEALTDADETPAAPIELEVADVEAEAAELEITEPEVTQPEVADVEADVSELEITEPEVTEQVEVTEPDADPGTLAAFAALSEAADSGYGALHSETAVTEFAEFAEFAELDIPMIDPAVETVSGAQLADVVNDAVNDAVTDVETVEESVDFAAFLATEPVLDIQPGIQPDVEPDMQPEPAQVLAEPGPYIPPARVDASMHDVADASRMLTQFAGESVAARPAPVEEAAPVAPEPAPANQAPRPRRENGLADTAALLRELSSLGVENTSVPRPTAPARPAATPPPSGGGQHARKRKGLFGRS